MSCSCQLQDESEEEGTEQSETSSASSTDSEDDEYKVSRKLIDGVTDTSCVHRRS